jgi:hypothetical protein
MDMVQTQRPTRPNRPPQGYHDSLVLVLWVLVLFGGLFAALWGVVSTAF